MTNGTAELKDKSLAQLEALRSRLTSPEWQIRIVGESAQEQGQNSDLLILLDARIAQLEDVQLAQIQKSIDACRAELNDAIAGVREALSDIEDLSKVLAAGNALLKVVGRILAVVAR
jgi:molybdenum cofactor biosynthesis enzyme MoaA